MKAKKYFNDRLCRGGDCTAKSQMFILDEGAKTVISMFCKEQFDKAINSIKRKAGINGIKGLLSKADVIKVLNDIKEEKFINHES